MTINSNSVIAILGGSGKAGRSLVEETLRAGYRVRILLRPSREFDLQSERLDVLHGDVRDAASVYTLLQGANALISTLGHTKGEATPMMALATQHYVKAMEASGISRCIVVSSLFATGHEQLDAPTQQAANYMQQHFPQFMNDRRLEFRLLSESGLDWTYVRVPYIVQGPSTGGYVLDLNQLPGQQITAVDLAHFLIDQLKDRYYIQKSPFVASQGS